MGYEGNRRDTLDRSDVERSPASAK